MCLLFSCPKDNNKNQRSFFHAIIYPTSQVCTSKVLGEATINEMVFRNTKPYLTYHVTGISQAAEVDLQKTDRVIITAKQLRRIIRE